LILSLGLSGFAALATAQPVQVEDGPEALREKSAALTREARGREKQGDTRAAVALRRQVVEIERKLHSKGHADLAAALNGLGALLIHRGEIDEAEPVLRETLDLRRRFYPKSQYPRGNVLLARSLSNMGYVHETRGRFAEAEACYAEALSMFRGLYGPEKYPRGHRDVAATVMNLAAVLSARGEYAAAEARFREGLEVFRGLYPDDEFPDGHPDLAQGMNNLGHVLVSGGKLDEAEKLFRQSLAMRRRFYPKSQYPRGHIDVALGLLNVAAVLTVRRDFAPAAEFQGKAVAMLRDLFPPETHPRGHPWLFMALSNLGVLMERQGQFELAEAHAREALAMQRRLTPADQYPRGHPDLVRALNNLGAILHAQGEARKAEEAFRDAVAMRQALFEAVAAGAPEAEALNFLAHLPDSRHGLLAVSARTGSDPAITCALQWQSRAAVARLLRKRRESLARLDDPETKLLAAKLAEARRLLAARLLRPAGDAPGLKALTEAKEALEKKLAERLPHVARERELDRLAPDDLAKQLPEGTAVLDFARYRMPGPADRDHPWHYTAFVVRRGRATARVDLGEAAPVEEALARWRAGLVEGRDRAEDPAALRRSLWQPVAAHLEGATTVYVLPDGPLTALPWAALPGAKPGTVLLEEHALAVLHHPSALMEARAEGAKARGPLDGRLLTVGGVDYGPGPPEPREPPEGKGAPALVWPALPASDRERLRVLALAGDAGVGQATGLSGKDAATDALLAELPKARWAHLATHGFFADARFRSFLQLEEKTFALSSVDGRERRFTPGARTPLALSGLALAGANLQGKDAAADGGVLTAEAVAGLNLDGLDLAVLSACDTGLGQVAGGEGVFGLQRAFHLAGCRDVVASLWKVDDEATAALMSLFYHNLWKEKLPPVEALRQAQLGLYRHQDRIPVLARERGVVFNKAARVPAQPAAVAPAHPRLWAGFVLSGPGR
jgi:CHAT domain-containing protein/Tfp pilus assembly protein PilF